MNIYQELIKEAREQKNAILEKIKNNSLLESSICMIIKSNRETKICAVANDSWHNDIHICFGGEENMKDVERCINEEEQELKNSELI